MHVIKDRLPEALEDSCKSWMKGRLNTKGSRDKKTGVFTKTIGEKQWTPSFYSHGTLERWMEFGPKFFHWCSCIFISYLYKQASRLLCWAVNGWSIQLKRSKVSVMVRDKPWLCLRCFQIEAGKTTQKDHAGRGVTEIQRDTWRLFTQGHPSEPWKENHCLYYKKCHIQKNSHVISGDLLMTIFVQNRSHARIFNLEEFGQRIVHNWIATNIELKLHSYLIQLIRFLSIL